MRYSFGLLLAVFGLAGCSVVGVRDGYEQPGYAVIESIGDDIEIRRYAPRLAAEATVAASDIDDGTDQVFRLLFDYITGANEPAAEIAMTSPVAVSGEGAEIAMTAPVETSAEAGRVTMRFFLPSSFDTASAPRPTDARVTLVEVPEQTVAALRYAGLWNAERAAEKRAALYAGLASGPWRPVGEAVSYYYDPPWTLPWFRRNEAVVPVARD